MISYAGRFRGLFMLSAFAAAGTLLCAIGGGETGHEVVLISILSVYLLLMSIYHLMEAPDNGSRRRFSVAVPSRDTPQGP